MGWRNAALIVAKGRGGSLDRRLRRRPTRAGASARARGGICRTCPPTVDRSWSRRTLRTPGGAFFAEGAGVHAQGFLGEVLGERGGIAAVGRGVLPREPTTTRRDERAESLGDVDEAEEPAGGALDDGGGVVAVLGVDAEDVAERVRGPRRWRAREGGDASSTRVVRRGTATPSSEEPARAISPRTPRTTGDGSGIETTSGEQASRRDRARACAATRRAPVVVPPVGIRRKIYTDVSC